MNILNGIKCIKHYIVGHFMLWMLYDKKYCTGKYFSKGVKSEGWKWVDQCGKTRLLLRTNCKIPWPVNFKTTVTHPQNIIFDPDDLNIFQSTGCYFQAIGGKIVIGKGTWIAPNVGLITSNHDIYNLNRHMPGKDIVIGEKSWIGMNAMILPGVTLGPRTVVGAGSVVTKSFPSGNCIIAGNPAKLIREIVDNIE